MASEVLERLRDAVDEDERQCVHEILMLQDLCRGQEVCGVCVCLYVFRMLWLAHS